MRVLDQKVLVSFCPFPYERASCDSIIILGMELWDGFAKYLLDALDSLQRRAVCIIGDEKIARYIEPLQLRLDVVSLSIFYRLYRVECDSVPALHLLVWQCIHT